MIGRFAFPAAIALAAMLWAAPASAQSCTGRFVNPISDVCWECLFPITIGPIRIGSASGAPDTPNPSSPICLCGSPIPRIGLSREPAVSLPDAGDTGTAMRTRIRDFYRRGQ